MVFSFAFGVTLHLTRLLRNGALLYVLHAKVRRMFIKNFFGRDFDFDKVRHHALRD